MPVEKSALVDVVRRNHRHLRYQNSPVGGTEVGRSLVDNLPGCSPEGVLADSNRGRPLQCKSAAAAVVDGLSGVAQ